MLFWSSFNSYGWKPEFRALGSHMCLREFLPYMVLLVCLPVQLAHGQYVSADLSARQKKMSRVLRLKLDREA